MSDAPKKSALWQFVSRGAQMPVHARGAVSAEGVERELGPNDLRPLRVDGDWRPESILDRFGPAADDTEILPRLIIACAVIQGAARVVELGSRLEQLAVTTQPRVAKMVDQPPLARRRADLARIVTGMGNARRELPAIRARAANDAGTERPDGLREVDLIQLAILGHVVILGADVAIKPSPAGVERAILTYQAPPDRPTADAWAAKLLPKAAFENIQLYDPPALGRVVVVYADGRLAYDPSAC